MVKIKRIVMKIIAGLGNPDKKYARTMHNMGFMAVDRLAEKLNINFDKKGFKGVYASYSFGGEKFIIIKPQTYMNLSGECIREVLNFYKLRAEDLLVVYDDLDINIGSLRIRQKGSAGTHNGMRNIVLNIQSENFLRIRVGTKPERSDANIIDYVLSDIPKSEEEKFDSALDRASDALKDFVFGKNIDEIMRKYNG